MNTLRNTLQNIKEWGCETQVANALDAGEDAQESKFPTCTDKSKDTDSWCPSCMARVHLDWAGKDDRPNIHQLALQRIAEKPCRDTHGGESCLDRTDDRNDMCPECLSKRTLSDADISATANKIANIVAGLPESHRMPRTILAADTEHTHADGTVHSHELSPEMTQWLASHPNPETVVHDHDEDDLTFESNIKQASEGDTAKCSGCSGPIGIGRKGTCLRCEIQNSQKADDAWTPAVRLDNKRVPIPGKVQHITQRQINSFKGFKAVAELTVSKCPTCGGSYVDTLSQASSEDPPPNEGLMRGKDIVGDRGSITVCQNCAADPGAQQAASQMANHVGTLPNEPGRQALGTISSIDIFNLEKETQ